MAQAKDNYIGALQDQQFHPGTDTETQLKFTANVTKDECHFLVQGYCPHSVMFSECGTTTKVKIRNQRYSNKAAAFMTRNPHPALILNAVELSMERMVLFQCDLMWENDIAAEYNSIYSTAVLPSADITKMNINKRTPRLLFTVTAEGTQCLCECNNRSARCSIKEIWDRRQETAAKTGKQRHCKRKLMANLSEAAKKRVKRNTINMFSDFTKRADLSVTNTRFSRISWDTTVEPPETEVGGHYDLLQLSPKLEAYAEQKTNISTMTSLIAEQNCTSPKNATFDGWCRMGSTVKDVVLSCFLFGDRPECVRDTSIPQSDSSDDYTVLGATLQQKTHCEIQVDREEDLCLTSNTDRKINQNVILPLHPFIPTHDVNSIGSNEAQGQKCIKWGTCENNKRGISTNMLTHSATGKCLYKTDFPSDDKENCHFGNSDESVLSSEETFSARHEEQHFLPPISSPTLATSSLGTPQNDFLFLHSNGLQSTSKIACFHEMADTSLMSSFKHEGNKLEQIEVELLLSAQNVNKRAGSVHLDNASAFQNQAFCFPSQFPNTVDTQQSEIHGSGKNTDPNWMTLRKTQLSVKETFQKISLGQTEDTKEIFCSFRSEPAVYKSLTALDNIAAKQTKTTACKSKCLISKLPYSNPSYSSDYKDDHDSYSAMKIDFILYGNICDTFIWGNTLQKDLYPSSQSKAGVEKNEHMVVDLRNRNVIRGVLPFTGSICLENTKKDCEERKGKNTPSNVTQVNTYGSRVDSVVPTEQMGYTMKAQFDLVLEELKLFHKIGEEKVDSKKAKEEELEAVCFTADELPEMFTESIATSTSVTYDGDGQDRTTEDNREVVIDVKEQEVPQQCMSVYTADEESLYSTNNKVVLTPPDSLNTKPLKNDQQPTGWLQKDLLNGDIAEDGKAVLWTPAFLTSDRSESSFNFRTEKEMTFSHGIRRVAPLKTRTGPLRIGLSKKAKIKQLHPYL